jgi:hypothetical protein
MKNSSPWRALVWAHNRSAAPAPLWPLVLVVVAEFTKAVVAVHRYECLKQLASESDDHAANNARRIYLEFYADR